MFKFLQLFTTLHLLGLSLVHQAAERHARLKDRREDGLESAQYAILGGISIAVALLVGGLVKAAISSHSSGLK